MKRNDLITEIDDVLRKHSSAHPANLHRIERLLGEARAALSSPCACQGKKPLANMVTRVPNPKAPARVESSLNIVWSMYPSIQPGDVVRVIILAAEEEAKE